VIFADLRFDWDFNRHFQKVFVCDTWQDHSSSMTTMNAAKDTNKNTSELETFASYTTLHGFQFTVPGNHPIRRCVWMAAMLVMFGTLFHQIYASFVRYLEYEAAYTANAAYKSNLKFPAVTICNINMMKKSKIVGKDAQAYLDSTNPNIPYFKKAKYVKDTFDLEQELLENGHHLENMLVKCRWGISELCSHKNFTRFFSMTVSGNW